MNPIREAHYDSFAMFYNKYWSHFNIPLMKHISTFVLNEVPNKSHLLDMCCGTGQLTKRLSKKGYTVTGVDVSSEMIEMAKLNVPLSEFLVNDIRYKFTDVKFNAILSIFDSLNHILNSQDLLNVFRNAHDMLLEEGIFFFDMLMEEGFDLRWTGTNSKVDDDYVYIDKSNFNKNTKIGTHEFTAFYLNQQWNRVDGLVTEKCFDLEEIILLLENSGFNNVKYFDFSEDLNIPAQKGRKLFVCKR